ncbi:MAG: nucleotidyltransferase family protein [Caulobacteraceae bacterium]
MADETPSGLERELAFVIACAAPPSRVDRGRLVERARSVDWRQVERLANLHLVRPLLLRRAATFAPKPVRGRWTVELRDIGLRTLGLTSALIAVTRSLQAAGVPILPHKGPVLALAAYGEIGLRECADLDVLVPEDRLAEALQVLARAGYARDTDLAWLSASALRRWTGEVSCRSAQGVTVDLHWRFTPPHYPLQLDPKWLWPHVRPLRLAGAELPALDPEAHFLVLAVHGAKHAWAGLGWVTDLAWLIDAGFDWAAAEAIAVQADCLRVFRLAALLAHQVFGSRIPEGVAKAIAGDRGLGRLAARVQARWLQSPATPVGSGELLSFVAALDPRPLVLARHLVGLATHPTEGDWRAFRLPENRFALYAPGRLGRFIARPFARG